MRDWTEILLRILVDSSLRMLVIAVCIVGILAVMRVRSSSVRHAALTAVLCAMLLMPALPSFLPRIPIPMPAAALAPARVTAPDFDITSAPANTVTNLGLTTATFPALATVQQQRERVPRRHWPKHTSTVP